MPIISDRQSDALATFEPHLRRIDEYLATCLRGVNLPPNLIEACEYALLAGGKRLRPLLTLGCCECCGGEIERALPAAASGELIHAFSLVHDDLPAMDDDKMRRGRPTVHVRFNEAMAILVGDALQALAFEQICRSDLHPHQVAQLIGELADATTRMIAGQVYDTLGGLDRGEPPRQHLETIHRNKTGALLRAACRMGCIAASGSPSELEAITTYGETVGLMFQIVDDLIDVTQSAEHTGKATGKDAQAGKLTFPAVLGIEESKKEVDRLLRESVAALEGFADRGQRLAELARYLATRTR